MAGIDTLRKAIRFAGLCAGVAFMHSLAKPDEVSAQAPETPSSGLSKTVQAVYADATPTIDGDLSDPVWQTAAPIDDFIQVAPEKGGKPAHPTRVRVAYDARHLYIGIEAFDAQPDEIDARIIARDGAVSRDDYLGIALDSYDNTREAYVFEIGAAGGKRDGFLDASGNVAYEWNTIWQARSRRTSDGWTAEVAIPFQSISTARETNSWGLQLYRYIPRLNQTIRWANIDPASANADVTRAGRLEGLDRMRRGHGVEIQSFITAKNGFATRTKPGEPATVQPSGNVFYKITPSLTGTLTLNADFPDRVLDDRQVNTTQFGLFQSETREFFLQDANFFAFGGGPLANDSGSRRGGGPNGLPFFSRRIGLLGDIPVDIAAGGKISGTHGRINIGALTAHMDDLGALESQQLSVVRMSADILDQSRVGFIATNGDPTGQTENSVLGADFQYQNAKLPGGDSLLFDGYYLRSFSDDPSDRGDSFAVQAHYPNDKLYARAMLKQIDAGFDPKLGFVNRAGTRHYSVDLRRRWRPSGALETVNLETVNHYWTDLSGEQLTGNHRFRLNVTTKRGDYLEGYTTLRFESVRDPFFLPRNVLVPRGDHRYQRYGATIGTNSARPFSASLWVDCCVYLDGRRLDSNFTLTAQPTSRVSASIKHDLVLIELPTGKVDVRVTSITAAIYASPTIKILTQTQYDNISRALGARAGVYWEVRPETEIFFSLGHAATTDFSYFTPTETTLTFRIGNRLRF
jgi:hypothetical protein